MEPRNLHIGDVVQISPESESAFRGCFLLVTEGKPFGCMGYVAMPEARGVFPHKAFYRARWDEIEYIGRTAWIDGNYDEGEH